MLQSCKVQTSLGSRNTDTKTEQCSSKWLSSQGLWKWFTLILLQMPQAQPSTRQTGRVKPLDRRTSSKSLWIEDPLLTNIHSAERSMSKVLTPYHILSRSSLCMCLLASFSVVRADPVTNLRVIKKLYQIQCFISLKIYGDTNTIDSYLIYMLKRLGFIYYSLTELTVWWQLMQQTIYEVMLNNVWETAAECFFFSSAGCWGF